MKDIFLPNKAVSKSTMSLVLTIQIIFVGIVWLFSPFVFLPTPSEVWISFTKLWADGLGTEMCTSFILNVQAMALATIITLLFSYCSVIPFFRPLIAFLGKLRFLSLIGLTFFFTLMAKTGHELKLYLLAFSMSVFFITSMADIINSIPKTLYDLARTLRMGEVRVVWEVVIRSQIDKVFDALRQNAAISWMMLTMIEGLSRSEGGVGTLLLNQNKHFHLSAIMAIQIVILLIGLGQDYVIGVLKGIFCPYAKLTTERK